MSEASGDGGKAELEDLLEKVTAKLGFRVGAKAVEMVVAAGLPSDLGHVVLVAAFAALSRLHARSVSPEAAARALALAERVIAESDRLHAVQAEKAQELMRSLDELVTGKRPPPKPTA